MFTYNKDFYPTPANLIRQMISAIKINETSTILEPSAGKGDIVDALQERIKLHQYSFRGSKEIDIDTIEIDPNLRHILKGKGYKVVHDDFLSYETYKRYDIIIMNPPFSEGDKHLLKALEMQQNGGEVICLLNAETLKNPCTVTRKDLIRKLEDHNATIDYITGAFLDAERQTPVEVALIKVNISQAERKSTIFENLKQEESYQEQQINQNQVTFANLFQRLVAQYQNEVKAGVKFINEYAGLKPHILQSLKETNYHKEYPIIKLEIEGYKSDHPKNQINAYVKAVRYKYWEYLFSRDEFNSLLTSNLRQEYYERIKDLQNYDFSLYNIAQIQAEIALNMTRSVEATIINLFDEFSHKHHWQDETSKNIHYYNGWKTNKSWKIKKKVIIPMYGAFNNWNGRFECSNYRVLEKLQDIEKVFNYLDQCNTEEINLKSVLESAQRNSQTRKIETKYFYLTFYKKGTMHIEFKNLELLEKFNIFGSQRKGWLPPSYGKKQYQDMTSEEKAVIDSFQGHTQYNKVLDNKEYYLVERVQLLMIA